MVFEHWSNWLSLPVNARECWNGFNLVGFLIRVYGLPFFFLGLAKMFLKVFVTPSMSKCTRSESGKLYASTFINSGLSLCIQLQLLQEQRVLLASSPHPQKLIEKIEQLKDAGYIYLICIKSLLVVRSLYFEWMPNLPACLYQSYLSGHVM